MLQMKCPEALISIYTWTSTIGGIPSLREIIKFPWRPFSPGIVAMTGTLAVEQQKLRYGPLI
jgi:hypothetical protein